VNGTVVTPDSTVASTGDFPGWLVTYTVKAPQRFHHLDVIPVNLTAIDASGDALPGFENFTFVVDDVPPTAHLADFAPRFRAGGDPASWNVSLQTRFSLSADDNDSLPTGIGRIRYSVGVAGGGSNAAVGTYDGPFTIGTLPGVYTGPRTY